MKKDAVDMQAFPRQNVNWQSHAEKIMAIKQDVNDVGKTLAKLNKAASEGSIWQQTAVARINPLMKEIAENTTEIIDHLNNEHGAGLNNPQHKDLLEDNAELASAAADIIADFVDYGQTRAKYMELRKELEVSEHVSRD